VPTNYYGLGDRFDLQGVPVLPTLIRKFHEAKEGGASTVTVWGTGAPRREFLHVGDLADASLFLMRHYDGEDFVNVGVGKVISIAELASLVQGVVGYEGEIVYDSSKPDGTARKLLDVSRLHALGWQAKIPLQEGIEQTYRWFLEHRAEIRGQEESPLYPPSPEGGTQGCSSGREIWISPNVRDGNVCRRCPYNPWHGAHLARPLRRPHPRCGARCPGGRRAGV
jgi:hypothetical protein